MDQDIIIIKPKVKVLDRYKLHISRRPGFTAWLLLTLSTLMFIGVSYRLTDNMFCLSILFLGEIIFGLDTLGHWEDLVLDRKINKAIVGKFTWTDKLSLNILDNVPIVMKLDDIRHVGVSIEMGLFILNRNGQTITLSLRGLTYQEIKCLRKEINCFLNMSRIKHFKYFPKNLHDYLIHISASDDECFGDIPKRHLPISIPSQLCILNKSSIKEDYPLQFNLSSPVLSQKAYNAYFYPCAQRMAYRRAQKNLCKSSITLTA